VYIFTTYAPFQFPRLRHKSASQRSAPYFASTACAVDTPSVALMNSSSNFTTSKPLTRSQ
ncbi:MAG: hypothetical protein Q7R34_15415, partial [Dehalococcoidia bacterium]|nr:hypothetical protein [Dehalococcoidia bacterium]